MYYQTYDEYAVLTEMYYCEHINSDGTQSGTLRGFTATFENPDTSSKEVFEFGSLVATASDVTVNC